MGKILIVDDACSNRVLLRRIFRDIYEIEEAENGVKALEIMRMLEIDTVLLDISMPELDGFGVLEAMRNDPVLSDIPVIVITANDGEENYIRALDLGAVDIIGNPFNPTIVLARVRNTIVNRKARQIAAESQLLKQQIKHQDEKLRLAQCDSLTGLYNRDTFCEKASEMIAEKPEKYYVISCFDIDNFKIINDQYGLEIGDLVIKLTAGIFEQFAMRSNGIACRTSADNFCILFTVGSVINLTKFLSVISSSLEKRGIRFSLQLSAGRYIVDDKTLTVSAMIDRALIAKRSVKGRYDLHMAYYNEKMRESIL